MRTARLVATADDSKEGCAGHGFSVRSGGKMTTAARSRPPQLRDSGADKSLQRSFVFLRKPPCHGRVAIRVPIRAVPPAGRSATPAARRRTGGALSQGARDAARPRRASRSRAHEGRAAAADLGRHRGRGGRAHPEHLGAPEGARREPGRPPLHRDGARARVSLRRGRRGRGRAGRGRAGAGARERARGRRVSARGRGVAVASGGCSVPELRLPPPR